LGSKMSAETPTTQTPAMTSGSRTADIAVAVRNAAKLGLSLLATWGLALIVRIQLPRHLGPVAFGNLNFAESFAASFFVFIGFGVETYVQKEVAVRPDHASDFFGGVVLVRAIIGVALFAIMATTLRVTHRPTSLVAIVLVFGATQYLMALGQFLSSMLRASTTVNALAAVNVASKILWAIGIVIGIAVDAPLMAFALPALLSEALRIVVLWRAAQSSVGLKWRIDRKVTTDVLVRSLPYFASAIAITLVNRLDVSMLEFIAPGPEVGWYSAANNLASLAMLLSPLVSWVLMPLLARARQRSREECFSILRRALEGFLVGTIPVTLIIALGADFWVRLLFGESFAPAAMSLRVLAPMFIATYACMVLSIGLVVIDRPWLVTIISLAGIIVQPAFTFTALHFTKRLGPGGVGAAAAFGVVSMEVFMMVILLWFLGRLAIDRRNLVATLKSILVALLIVPLDHYYLVRLGWVRFVADIFVYAVIALLVQVESIKDIRSAIAAIRARKAGGVAAPT
jgi:O-antigen/teichoic acid export membrane protein